MFPDVLGVCVLVKLVITSPVVVEWSLSYRPAIKEKIAIITYTMEERATCCLSLSSTYTRCSEFEYLYLQFTFKNTVIKLEKSALTGPPP